MISTYRLFSSIPKLLIDSDMHVAHGDAISDCYIDYSNGGQHDSQNNIHSLSKNLFSKLPDFRSAIEVYLMFTKNVVTSDDYL